MQWQAGAKTADLDGLFYVNFIFFTANEPNSAQYQRGVWEGVRRGWNPAFMGYMYPKIYPTRYLLDRDILHIRFVHRSQGPTNWLRLNMLPIGQR